MALFGSKKKKEEPASNFDDLFPAEPPETPNPMAEQVAQLRQQGYADDQIVQWLQGQGYTPDQINDAMAQDMPTAGPLPSQDFDMQPPAQPMQRQQPMQVQQPPAYSYPQQQASPDKDRIEEVAEAIIDEKWNKLIQDINKVIEWKEKAETRLLKMEQEVKDVKESFDALHKGVLGKIGEYDQNLANVGVEIKAMEKVFQKVLPTFTENVNKLERFTKDNSMPMKKK